jgi:acetyl-CoA C-acetyltransferase
VTVDPRTPCLIGVAQRTVRPGEGPSPEPLDLWEDATRRAAADAHAAGGSGSAGRVLAAIDSLQVVYCMAWTYDAPVDRLAGALGIEPRHRHYSGIGGTTPQVLVQEAAAAILRGEMDLAAITGAEALETKRQAKKASGKAWADELGWRHRHPEPPPFPFEAPFHPAEVAHDVFQAWLTFPTFDLARRARLGTAPADYARQIGELLAPMSEVAAANPYAWFPRALSAEHLATPTPANRMVGYPYTKQAVSIMDVDMAATVLVASHQKADELGVPQERRVYLHGWCYATDPVYVAEHPDLSSSPAMAAASAEALRCAGATIDEVAHLDLYSCFASSVHLACDALGIDPHDPTETRPLTVTGGLPFAGGAGSNYVMHSLATMVDVLRGDPGSLGLVSGVGMHLTKHVYGVYSSAPPPTGRAIAPDEAAIQARLDHDHPRTPIVESHEGPATIATYTVAHGRDGSPEWALVIVDVPGGRAYGRVEDAGLLTALEAGEWIGRSVDLTPGPGGVNLVRAS